MRKARFKLWSSVMAAAGLIIVLSASLAAGEPTPGRRIKIGLALSGGGSKGLAHIGVLRVLEEIGVPVDMIAGTSMGSIIGGLYSAGYSPDQLERIVKQVDWMDAFLPDPSRRLLRYDKKDEYQRYLFEVGVSEGGPALPAGVLSDYKLMALLTSLSLPVANIKDFDELPIPFRTVATDIVNGDKVVLSKGRLAQAMRASMSIPGAFAPYELEGRLLVDGGVVENLPVQTVLDMGADVVIAVNVSSPLLTRDKLDNFVSLLDQTMSIQMVKSTEHQISLADLTITPKVQRFGTFDFDQADELIKIGVEAARQAEPEIRALLKAKGIALVEKSEKRAATVKEFVLKKVTLVGPAIYQSEINRLAKFKPGQTVTIQELDETVQKIYGLGTLESVSYDVVPTDDGRAELRFILKEKPASWRGRMGLAFSFDNRRSQKSQLTLNLEKPNLFSAGSNASVELTFGRNFGFMTELYIPDRPFTGFFFKPSLYYTSKRHSYYHDRDILAEYTIDTAGGLLRSGYYLGTFGELSLGYFVEQVSTEPRIATLPLDDRSDLIAGLQAGLGLDTLDRKPLPRSGVASDMTYTEVRPEFGSEVDYNRATWSGLVAIPLTDRLSTILNWDLASSLNSDPPAGKNLYLGGYPGMLGYAEDEFFGMDLARFQLLARYRFTKTLYLKLSGNGGATWENLDQARYGETRWYWGGGAGVAWNSIIGPVELTLGVGEEGRVNVYLNFGYPF